MYRYFGLLLIVVLLTTCNTSMDKDAIHITKDGPVYNMQYGPLSVAVDANAGGRITAFRYNDYQLLMLQQQDSLNFGSTFWPSPQRTWFWPPPHVLDSKPYQVVSTDGEIHLRSAVDSNLGISIGKRLIVDTSDTTVVITYTIHNETDSTLHYAPWENTRLPNGGTLVYPSGKEVDLYKTFDPVPVSETGELTFYDDDEALPDTSRLNVDDGSEGWMAYLIDDHAFVKSFPPIDPEEFAPGEGEIEFYLSPSVPYLEMEVQGAYQPIDPGQHLSWTMRWKLRPATQLKKPEKLRRFISEQ